MNTLLYWGATIFFLTLLFLLAKFFIKKYFDSKKGHYDANKSNYISAIAITSIMAGFVILNPKSITYIINFSINNLNRGFSLELSNFQRETTLGDIIIYSILCISIIFVIYLSYRHRIDKIQLYYAKQREANKESRKIIFPEHEVIESPFLHDRIKELFELKYKRFQLELKETKFESEDKVLYGSYQDDFNTIYEIIYCDVSSSKLITAKQVTNVLDYLNIEILKKISKHSENLVAHFYYITESNDFETANHPPQIKLYTENQFLSSIIDFRRYLIKLQHNFENEKLFSAIHTEDQKKTLAETFIEPSFYIGDKRDKRNNKLLQYVKNWIEESGNQKHLVLLGDYGMGKTSFIKYFASKLASSDITSSHITRFPVYISLTNCSPIHGGIYKTIKSFVAENLGVDFDLFKKLIDRGKILFLLDSFDEMGFIGTKDQRFKQFNEIWQLATKNNKIIITGRPSYFPTEFELKQILSIPLEGHEIVQTQPFAERLTLCKLDENQIISYIEKYYPEKARTYYKWIKSNNGLLELCKRPSMMHIISRT